MVVSSSKKSICMPVYSFYPFDPRVRRAAEALIERGHSVDVICLKEEGDKSADSFNGVGIYRVSLTHKRGGYLRYLYHYSMFFLQVFFTLNALDRKKKYDIIHVHSLPDFLVFVAKIQKFKGKKIVLDLHEVMPEIFAARFNKNMNSPLVKVVGTLERISCAFANSIITVNDARKAVLISRGIPKEKITVIMNAPDKKLFVKKDLLKDEIPNLFFILFGHTYGQGEKYLNELKNLAKDLGISKEVYFGGQLAGEEVASFMELADFGVVSYLKNPMTELAMPNKVFEYSMADVPIISCKLKGIHALLGDDAAIYFEPENHMDLAKKIKWIHENPDKSKKYVEAAQKIYRLYNWENMKKRLMALYENL
jgi:glycosyltransferase involved in cell wall biosynthesis